MRQTSRFPFARPLKFLGAAYLAPLALIGVFVLAAFVFGAIAISIAILTRLVGG